VAVLRALVAHFTDQPNLIPGVRSGGGLAGGTDRAVFEAVAYVAGMTDRFAMAVAVSDLGWDRARLPRGVDYLTGR
jgi:dGTPase